MTTSTTSLLGSFVVVATMASTALPAYAANPHTNPPPEKIYASKDPEIAGKCPKLSNVATVTIPAHLDINYEIGRNPPDDSSLYPLIDGFGIPTLHVAEAFKQTIDRQKLGIVQIDTRGGSYGIYKKMEAKFRTTKTPVITVAFGQASSAGFLALISGQVGSRYAHHDSRLMVHEVSYNGALERQIQTLDDLNYDSDGLEFLRLSFALHGITTDAAIVRYIKKDLLDSTDMVRDALYTKTTTGVSGACAFALIQPGKDTFMYPLTALKWGYIDTIVNEDGTMTVRANDPRIPKPEEGLAP